MKNNVHILAIPVLMLLPFLFSGCGSSGEATEVVDGGIRIPVASVSDGKAHYYSMSAGGTEVSFFVLQSPDGVIRAAFDACDVCYEARKGYEQDGEFMVCRNCGRKFHASRINEVEGGCNPAPLNRTLVDDMLVIRMDDVAKGARFF